VIQDGTNLGLHLPNFTRTPWVRLRQGRQDTLRGALCGVEVADLRPCAAGLPV